MASLPDKIFSFIFSRRSLIALLILSAVVFAVSLWNRYIQSDENWFGEQAYWLLHEGVVKIKSMKGVLGFDTRMFVYHQLLVYIGAGMVKLFGWSVYVLKNFILAVYLLFFILYFVFYKRNTTAGINQFILSSLLIFICPIMAMQGYMFRPEIVVMVFGFAAYYCIHRYCSESRTAWVLLAAIFSGMAFLTTFNGLAFPVAGFFVLLFRKKYNGLIIFSLAAAAVCSLFSFELWQGNNFETFMYQFRNWPTWKFGTTYLDQNIYSLILKKLVSLANIFQFFFWSDRVMFFSLIFFTALIGSFKTIWQHHRSMLIYLAAVMISLDLLGSFIAERYLIYVFPYMAFLSGYAVYSGNLKKAYRYLIMLFFVVQVPFTVKAYRHIFSLNNDHAAFHSGAIRSLPDEKGSVVAPWTFIFDEIGKFDHISYKAIEYYEDDLGKRLNGKEFLDLVSERYDAKYIIVQRTKRDEPDWYAHWFDNMEDILNHPRYCLIKAHEEYYILKAK